MISSGNKKGVKLDFKSLGGFKAAVQILLNKRGLLNFPVWVNADVLTGPNAEGSNVNAESFFNEIERVFPQCTISPGWKTGLLFKYQLN